MKWGLTRPRWELLLCAIGIHKFDVYCASAHHGRDTMRTCYTCEYSDRRSQKHHKWGDFDPTPSSDAARTSPVPKTEASSTPPPCHEASAAASDPFGKPSGIAESISKSGVR